MWWWVDYLTDGWECNWRTDNALQTLYPLCTLPDNDDDDDVKCANRFVSCRDCRWHGHLSLQIQIFSFLVLFSSLSTVSTCRNIFLIINFNFGQLDRRTTFCLNHTESPGSMQPFQLPFIPKFIILHLNVKRIILSGTQNFECNFFQQLNFIVFL